MSTQVAQAAKKVGKQSLRFTNPAEIWSTFTVVGPMEGKGPLGDYFDTVLEQTYYGEKCWERAETKMLEEAIKNAVQKANLQEQDIDFCITSDLLNQCTASSFAARGCQIPNLGIYSACAGLSEGLILGSMALDGGFARHVVVGVSSHHDAAERQYRYPTELGVQRPPYAQWTVTGAGAIVLGEPRYGIRITEATVGCVQDLGIKDPLDMGSAMAPAAADTIQAHFDDFDRGPDYFDLIVTGDLARVGSVILRELLKERNIDLGERHTDCGTLVYDKRQDAHSGGSGLGCSGTVFPAHLLRKMAEGELRRILFAGTGSLHSPTTSFQGESIPTICHAVVVEVTE